MNEKTLFKTLETYQPLYGDHSSFGLALFAVNYLQIGHFNETREIIDKILRMYTSNFYHSGISAVNASSGLENVKVNEGFWQWLCGPNEMAMHATNCLPSAASFPFIFTWGYLGMRLGIDYPHSEPHFKTIMAFQPREKLPNGLTSISLLNFQLPSFVDMKTISVHWDTQTLVLDFKVRNTRNSNCRIVCLVDQVAFKLKKITADSDKKTVRISSPKDTSRNFPKVFIICIPY